VRGLEWRGRGGMGLTRPAQALPLRTPTPPLFPLPLPPPHPQLSPPPPNPPSYMSLARFNAKFERAYVEQAREDVQWERRQKECLDGERDLMQHVKGWVVGGRRYFTQWEDKPDKDVLDQRVRSQSFHPPLPPSLRMRAPSLPLSPATPLPASAANWPLVNIVF
jgi:hypothetical protein